MHIDLINTFIQVAKARHFRKASDQLPVSAVWLLICCLNRAVALTCRNR